MRIIQNLSFRDRCEYNEISIPLWRVFALKYGYAYRLYEDAPPPGRDGYWAKLPGIIDSLQNAREGETILYLDGDTIPVRDESLDVLTGDIGMVQAGNADEKKWFNTGVIFAKAGAKTARFFKDCLDKGPVNGEAGDQERINLELKTSSVAVQILDNRYNAYAFAPSQTPVIRGFHGEVDKSNAARLMRCVLAGVYPANFGMKKL